MQAVILVKALHKAVSCHKSVFLQRCSVCRKLAASPEPAKVCSSVFPDSLRSRLKGGFDREPNYP